MNNYFLLAMHCANLGETYHWTMDIDFEVKQTAHGITIRKMFGTYLVSVRLFLTISMINGSFFYCEENFFENFDYFCTLCGL